MRVRMAGASLLLLALTAVDGLSEDACVVLVGKALNARSSYSVKDILENKVGGCTVRVLDYIQDLPKAEDRLRVTEH